MRRESVPRVEIRLTQRFSAPPERVFDAWIDPAIAGQWLFATATRPAERVEIDARVGGNYQFVERRRGDEIVHAGAYVEIDRPRRIVFTLSDRKGRVSVAIVPLGTGCELTLAHEHVHPDHATRVENRWTGMLYGLETIVGRNDRKTGRGGPVGPNGASRT